MRRPLLLLVCCFLLANSYKILVYDNKFGHSMTNFMGSIAETLVDAGHDVTSLISIIDPNVRDGSEKSKKVFVEQSNATKNLRGDFTQAIADYFTMNDYDPIDAYFAGKFFSKVVTTQCRAVLESPLILEQLKIESFDVMIVENFDMCGIALTEVLKPKAFIGASSHVAFGPQLEEFGIPAFPSFDPTLSTPGMNVHSLWDRLVNLYADLLVRWSYYYMRTYIDDLFKERFGPEFPSVRSIATHSAFNFVNSEPLIDFATPTMSKVVYIGGIGTRQPQKLSTDWEKVLAIRNKTILLSFGSVCKSIYLSLDTKRAILEALRSLPEITFIWKYEVVDDFSKSEASKVSNVVLTQWMPQTDILHHPNLTAFITHGGMGSTLETARAGVPAVIVPLFADQPRNAGMMEYNGLGRIFDKFEIHNSEKFAAIIKEVAENVKYRHEAQRISSMLRRKPQQAQELVVKYVEFAAEFGAASALRPLSHEMNWVEYRNADIIAAAFLLFSIFTAAVFKILVYCIQKIAKSKIE